MNLKRWIARIWRFSLLESFFEGTRRRRARGLWWARYE